MDVVVQISRIDGRRGANQSNRWTSWYMEVQMSRIDGHLGGDEAVDGELGDLRARRRHAPHFW